MHLKKFLTQRKIDLVLVATVTPQANGQVERVDQSITTMLAKKTVALNKWEKVLDEVEYALNNMSCASTGETSFKLLFGFHHGSSIENEFKILSLEVDEERNLDVIRSEAADNNIKDSSI